jgi:hypothetical protein
VAPFGVAEAATALAGVDSRWKMSAAAARLSRGV